MGDTDYSNNTDDGKRLSSLYDSNSDNFRRVFGILLGIGLFFLLTLILPYFLNIYELDQNTIQTTRENKTIQQSITDIHKSELTITNIKKTIDNLSKNINKTKSMMDTQISKANTSLSDADKLLGNISDAGTVEKLKKILSKTQYKLNGTLRFASIAIQSFYNSSSIYEDRLEKKNQKLKETYSQLEQAKLNLQKAIKNRDMLTDRLENLTQRWKEIQTPYGNLPIDFTNLLAIFPLAVSTGFFICCYLLGESIRHRAFIDVKRGTDPNTLHRLDPNGIDRRVDTSARDPNRSEVSVIAPLWIDPITKQKNLIRYFLLSTPVIIFVLSVTMIVFAWEHAPTDPFPTSSEVNQIIYYIAYSACFGLIAYGYWKIHTQVQRYKQAIWKS